MSHQPFETWLLSEEPLEAEQARALQAHLDTCEACRSLADGWAEVRSLFVNSTLVEPATGFSARWQTRVLARQSSSRYSLEQEQSILFIGVTAGITLLLLLALLASGIVVFDSPSQVLMVGFYSLGNLISSLDAMENILVVMTQILPEIVPPAGWVVLVFLAGLLIFAWSFMLKKILVPRRVSL